jgi:tetratricopeptide (TPR) repeat protein
MKKISLNILLLFLACLTYATESQVVIAKANKAYNDGLYPLAIEQYKAVLKSGLESPELYYNLGNAFYKQNDYASAILYYEKAMKLDPSSEDINFNLNVTNSKIADKIEPLPELFYKRWYRSVVEMMPVDSWAWKGIIFLVIALSGGALYYISRRLLLRKIGFWTGLVCLFCSVFSLSFAYQGYQTYRNNKEAVIFTPTVTLKSSPDEKSIDLFVLHEGTKVRVIDNIGTWYEIRIPNGSVGWLPVSSVERI